MIPGKYNFPTYRRGDTFNGHSFEILLNAVPVDLTGAVIKIQMRRSPGSKVVIEWLTSDGSITISGAGNNILRMEEKTGEQMQIEPATYKYDINVVLANGVTNTYVEGTFTIADDISR